MCLPSRNRVQFNRQMTQRLERNALSSWTGLCGDPGDWRTSTEGRLEVEGGEPYLPSLGSDWLFTFLFWKLIMGKMKHLPSILRRNSHLYQVDRKLVLFLSPSSLCPFSLSLSAVERTAKFKLSCGNPNEIIDPGKYQWMLKLSHETLNIYMGFVSYVAWMTNHSKSMLA